MMEKIAIHSSFIMSAAYNEDKQCLRLEIHSTYYYYYGVTRQKVSRFKKAESKGKYFIAYIKGKYVMAKRKMRRRS